MKNNDTTPSHQPSTTNHPLPIVALAGGVGGAKLAHGLAQVLPPEDLTVIVNTGDDFEHLGLNISPDLDTVCYTLAGLANPVTGWGRANESWQVIENIEKLGGPTWFRLGDRDLGTHLERTSRLRHGETLSQITKAFCAAWGVGPTVLPMSDQPVHTIVDTHEDGKLAFQDYFVRLHCEPRVLGFRFDGIEGAQPAPGVVEALQAAKALIVCPSNPWVSIDPILAVTQLRSAKQRPPVIAVSPIIGGQAVKGPAAKMYAELGIQPSALAVAKHYQGLLDGFVLDQVDADQENEIQALGIQTLVTDTLMKNLSDRVRVAEDVLHLTRRFL
jgi:LPPG:FO 2-phospho-L-lactate transferase